MVVEISAEAERDLFEIGLHIARDNPAAGLRFITSLRSACKGLEQFPERFALVPRYEVEGIRHRVHGNNLIFYRVEEIRVVVLHILHGAMDYAPLLSGDQ